jgi:hypothetical protein
MLVKSDGGVEAFERSKLRRCIELAMRASRRDPHIADALSRAIELHLRDWPDRRPPTTEHVFHCVQRALSETGLDPAAQFLSRHRRSRAGRRSALVVIGAGGVDSRPAPWKKSLVSDLLERRHGLSRSTARILAGEIEERVLSLGYRVVTARLIVELVRSELAAWGLGREVIGDAERVANHDVLAVRPPTKES